MAKLKLIKSFVHNVADSYLSTLGWMDGDYLCTWVYRAAKESGAHEITYNIRRSQISPASLKYEKILRASLARINSQFDSMLKTQGLSADFIPELEFKFSIPQHDQSQLHVICVASAVDQDGKTHLAAPIEHRYDYEVLAT